VGIRGREERRCRRWRSFLPTRGVADAGFHNCQILEELFGIMTVPMVAIAKLPCPTKELPKHQRDTEDLSHLPSVTTFRSAYQRKLVQLNGAALSVSLDLSSSPTASYSSSPPPPDEPWPLAPLLPHVPLPERDDEHLRRESSRSKIRRETCTRIFHAGSLVGVPACVVQVCGEGMFMSLWPGSTADAPKHETKECVGGMRRADAQK
jgi:hypothetical protein